MGKEILFLKYLNDRYIVMKCSIKKLHSFLYTFFNITYKKKTHGKITESKFCAFKDYVPAEIFV